MNLFQQLQLSFHILNPSFPVSFILPSIFLCLFIFTSAPPPPLNDPFDFFNTLMMPNIPLGDLDWLNIESEENIRPRKRQNIITISRMSSSIVFIIQSIDFLL